MLEQCKPISISYLFRLSGFLLTIAKLIHSYLLIKSLWRCESHCCKTIIMKFQCQIPTLWRINQAIVFKENLVYSHLLNQVQVGKVLQTLLVANATSSQSDFQDLEYNHIVIIMLLHFHITEPVRC